MKTLVLLWLVGCTSFDPITRNVCGNGIVEAGEDCDSTDPSCIACAVACTTAMDCPNTAYTCGTDDRCHAPGGTLGQGQVAGSFAVDNYRITDIDQDGIGDVVGMSRSSINVRHGAASGQLSQLESTLTPTQTGPASFGNLDGDSSLDVAITTPDGIVAYTSPYGSLSPLDVNNLIADPNASAALDVRFVFTVTHEAIGGFVVDDSNDAGQGKVAYAVFDFADIKNPPTGAPCGQLIDQTALSPDNIDVYQVAPDGVTPADTVVAMLTGTGALKRLCVMAIHKQGLASLSTVTDITPANAPMYATKPILADLSVDADHCPSLIDVDGGPAALKKYDGAAAAIGDHHCTLKPAASGGDPVAAVPVGSPSTKLIGRAALNPVFPGYANDQLVTSDGIYVYNGTAFAAVYQSARPWSHVAFADLDQDGSTDLVLAGEGADDLDILYNRSVLSYPVYELLRLDTEAEVSSIVIDDYDGNGYLDILFSEKLANHTALDVSYNTSDRPLDPVQVGAVANLIASAKIGFPDSADPLDQVADLLVLTPGDPYAGLTFLHGSAQRTMMPYFDPRTSDGAINYQKTTLFRGSVIGSFVPTIGGGADHPDLAGIAVPTSTGSTAGPDPRVWIADGNVVTLDSTQSAGAKLTGLAACGLGTANTGCVEEAVYFPWQVTAGASPHDVVFAIDHKTAPTASVFDPSSLSAASIAAAKATGFAPIPTGSVIQAIHAADLDGDGNQELIAAFAPSDAGSTGGVLVCEVDATGQPHDCTDLVAGAIAAIAPNATCFDAAPGHFTARDRFSAAAEPADLVVACKDTGTTLYRVTAGATGYTAEVLLHTSTALASIQAGDVTGDGVDDIVALEGAAGTQSLVVFSQCTSRNASSCTGESR